MLNKKKLTTVTVSGTEIPIACNLNVLEVIQEQYMYIRDNETVLASFQQNLGAYHYQKDDKGNLLKNKEGKPIPVDDELHIPTIKKAFAWMAAEGMDIAGMEPISEADLIRMVDISPFELATKLFIEFQTSLTRKNLNPTQEKKKSPEKTKK